MEDEEIEYQTYVTPTRFTHAMGIVLIIQLLRTALSAPSAFVRRALDKMRDTAVEAQSLAAEQLGASSEKLKPIDLVLDNAVMGLREVLEGKARLAGTEIGARAAQLLAQVFPNGTGFVMFVLSEEWGAVKAHLDRIERLDLEDEIDEVAGPEFLPVIRETHAQLGEGLGLGETPLSAPDTARLRASSIRMAKAIAAYGRAMLATVDEDDPESIAAFKRAMYPLDAYRRAAFARGVVTENEEPILDTDVTPTDPIPPVPAGPVA